MIGTLGAVYVYELDADQVSQELEWPSWMIYLCIPLGSYLMSLSLPAGGLALSAHRFPAAPRPCARASSTYGEPELPVPEAAR